MQAILLKTLRDIVSPWVLVFVLKAALLALVATGAVLWAIKPMLLQYTQRYIAMIPWEWLQSVGVKVAFLAMGYMLFIFFLSMAVSLLIEPLLKRLALKHYGIEATGEPQIVTSVGLSVKSGLAFLLLFMVTFPLMFVPLVGAIYLLYLWSIPLNAPSRYDVEALFALPAPKGMRARLIAMAAAAFNYLPVLNVFAPVFAEIAFMHAALRDVKPS